MTLELPPQDQQEPRVITLLTDAPNISDEELQIVEVETTDTNNILDKTIDKMLNEFGNEPLDTGTIKSHR